MAASTFTQLLSSGANPFIWRLSMVVLTILFYARGIPFCLKSELLRAEPSCFTLYPCDPTDTFDTCAGPFHDITGTGCQTQNGSAHYCLCQTLWVNVQQTRPWGQRSTTVSLFLFSFLPFLSTGPVTVISFKAISFVNRACNSDLL